MMVPASSREAGLGRVRAPRAVAILITHLPSIGRAVFEAGSTRDHSTGLIDGVFSAVPKQHGTCAIEDLPLAGGVGVPRIGITEGRGPEGR